MRSEGWQIESGQLVPPGGIREDDADPHAAEQFKKDAVADMMTRALEGQAAGKKRRKNRAGNGGGESTEDEELPLGSGLAAYLRYGTGEKAKDS